MMDDEIRLVLKVSLGLMILLALTAGASSLHLGRWNLVLSLGFSIGKTALIAGYFMELRKGGGRLWLFAGAGFFWLLILVGLSLGDYLTRFRPL
jgi:cytochrome c oxidase subunit 4